MSNGRTIALTAAERFSLAILDNMTCKRQPA